MINRHLSMGSLLLLAATLIALLGLVVIPAQISYASTFTVTSTADAPDADVNDGICATAMGECTLRAAVQQANFDTASDPDTITLPTGTYTLSQFGTGEDAGLTGDIDINGDLTIEGVGASSTIIQAGVNKHVGIDRVFDVIAGNVTFSNVTIQYGNATDEGGGVANHGTGTLDFLDSVISDNAAGDDGGGIYSHSGDVYITNTTVTENIAGEDGGGIYAFDSLVNLSDSVVSDNVAGDDGAGIWQSDGNVVLSNTDVVGNVAGEDAGGIRTSTGDVEADGSNISFNAAGEDGGGIRTSHSTSTGLQGHVVLTNTTVNGNRAGEVGGGISASNGLVQLTASTVSGNQAEEDGGGVDTSGGPVVLTNSTISGNRAVESGGGINTSSGTILAANSTISDNFAYDDGGGISKSSSTGNIDLTNVTIAYNGAAGLAGGLSFSGNAVAVNTIIANSTSGADCSGALTSGNNNLDSDGSCSLATQAVLDLGPLQDNGGPTFTHALLPGSPAIDSGDDTVCPATDQRGATRPEDGDSDTVAVCDVGAFEAAVVVVLEADLEVTKTDVEDPVVVGSDVTYIATVTNYGPDTAENVVLTDTLPEGVTLVSATPDQGSCVEDSGVVSCNLGNIPSDGSVDVTLVVSADVEGTLTNSASVASDTPDSVPDNNADSEDTLIDAAPAPTTGEGCSPGFWKQKHHKRQWVNYSPYDNYEDVFGVDTSFGKRHKKLLDVLKNGGGGEKALGRQAVAALLNAANLEVSYLYTEAQVIQMVQDAYTSSDYESAKDLLEEQNSQGCPLHGYDDDDGHGGHHGGHGDH